LEKRKDTMATFTSKAIFEHAEVPLADDGRWEALVEHWTARSPSTGRPTDAERRIYVASVGTGRDPVARRSQLGEILSLVRTEGGRVVGHEICVLAEPNPRTLLGAGTAEAIAERARTSGATMLVLDAELTPSQTRNLEDIANIPVCDREAIILNVFLRHARTRRAKIQVEIAQLEYLRPRIRGVGLDMDQQTGGTTRARGPGETASELLARKLDSRLEALRKALRRIETSAATQRQQRANCRRIVLVGYTNAGKTSLMNALTAADLSARDRPFETLDTTSRCLTRHGGDVLVSDTVGFIRRLPERLLASFESTLAEITEASLIVVVVDASDAERELHLETTREVLARMGAGEIPRFYIFNKLDLVGSEGERDFARWSEGHPWAALSAMDAKGVADLEAALLGAVRVDEGELTVFVPYPAAELLGLVYAKCRVLESSASGGGLTLRVRGPRSVVARLRVKKGGER
jgi:GTP-binding protein HflX